MPEAKAKGCSLCGAASRRLGVIEGFIHYAFIGLCPACVARVRAAGPARERRLRANQVRIESLIERFPTLTVSERARNRSQLDGVVDGRAVCLTLRVSPREYSDERYVFRVQLYEPSTAVERSDLQLEPRLLANLSRGSPKLTVSQHRWLHASFLHLGKLDTVWVLEGLITTAVQLDARAR